MAPNGLNYVLPSDGGLSMVVVTNAKINESRAASAAAAPATAATKNAPEEEAT